MKTLKVIFWTVVWMGTLFVVAVYMGQLVFFDVSVPGAAEAAVMEAARNTTFAKSAATLGITTGIVACLYSVTRCIRSKSSLLDGSHEERLYQTKTKEPIGFRRQISTY